MLTKIRMWGNSLGLRIPKSFAAETGVEAGSAVDISVENGDLVIRPVRRRKYDLQELLEKVSSSNVHGEVSTGKPRGREVW